MLFQDTLRKRYFYKVVANVITGAAGVVSQSVISRGLGAAQYGNFNFLTDFFTQFLAFLNMGSSVAFYTKLSKRPHESKLVSFYFSYIHLAIIVAILIAGIVIISGAQKFVWPGQVSFYIFAALIFAGINWLYNSMNDVVDAYGLTVAAETAKGIQRLLGTGIILFLFYQHWINMDTVFGFNYIILLIAIGSFIYICKQNSKSFVFERFTGTEVKSYIREFHQYSQPLLIISLFGLGTGIFDRWFLQMAGGDTQQGFYSLSFKIGALCFVLTGAMTQLITREFSIAYEKKDLSEMARLFRRHIPLLYGITAIMSCFVVVNADKVALIIGGKEFKAAIIPVAIMALYPIHQTYGQLSAAVFFATDQTRLYCKVVIFCLIIGVLTTYFLLAAPGMFGLGMGAVGLSVKMVLANIITNNILLYFNARFLSLPFVWYLKHQLISVLVFITLAFIATFGVEYFFPHLHVLLRFMAAGVGYLLITAGVIYLFPDVLGIKAADISAVVSKVKSLGR